MTHQKAGNAPPRTPLREVIHAVIHKDEAAYIAECLEVAVVTQGDTLDEVTENLKQAVSLHLDGEDLASLRLAEHPRLQVVYDVSLAS
jgi:predicted RNase H-like HicB family nuclease